jgi:hypothetical protein
MVFFAEVVLIEQAPADARKADMKSLASWLLNLSRAQCSMLRTWFHDGRRPGISSEKIRTGVGEFFSEVMRHRWFSLLK